MHGTQSTLHSEEESPPHPPPMCRTHLGDARQPFCARTLTTHQLSGGEYGRRTRKERKQRDKKREEKGKEMKMPLPPVEK
ncbi:hypothetical protein UPYG_G00338190 [Umbra pygmaea]|uniref:Uncharacterized protein n=1 Tax=Umbra pygmaea TaxID=75934 RepID=A0ABD0WAT3_UMBPY